VAMTWRRLVVGLCLLACCASGRSLRAESPALSGVVRDPQGKPQAGAEVELHAEGRVVARTVTDGKGSWTFRSTVPGSYTLTASSPGLGEATQQVVVPRASAEPVVLTLAGSYADTVVVRVPPLSGPGVSPGGANDFTAAAQDIAQMPAGALTSLTDVLTRMPGVAFDQNGQIHIRNTEGPQFQYQINGVLVPLDINTNPPFLSMINPMFIKQVDLLDGILPSRFSYATGGVVDITTKDGCSDPGGSLSILGGQRDTFEPSVQYAGCSGKLSYYVNALYGRSNTAFSSATPGPTPIHDETNQGQAFGFFTYQIDPETRLSVVTTGAASNNQLPNVPNLAPAFSLAGAGNLQSGRIDSSLNFRDAMLGVSLNGVLSSDMTYHFAYTLHSIQQSFVPDQVGELVFQGVASTASHKDLDNTLQGDLTWHLGSHTLGTGFYTGIYHVDANDSSLVFPVDADGNQTSNTPVHIADAFGANNVISGVYINDLWEITERLRANLGLRWDDLTGFTQHNQFDPTINFSFLATPDTTLHAGFARYMQLPSFLGIAPNAATVFAGTSAEGPPGVSNPLTEDDYEWDLGIVHRFTPQLSVSEDNFYESTHHYLDTGQFSDVPIFAPFNYDHGYIWGCELAVNYRGDKVSAYTNVTVGENRQIGVDTGQFNFDPDELQFIEEHHIYLDHQPFVGVSSGASYSLGPYGFGLDAIYSSGLRGGFADQEQLPAVFQVNFNIERTFQIPKVGRLTDRLIFLNLLDRTNLIRPSEGIGIFQSAYGPRFTILNMVTIPF
jgi:hypothetical protein